MKVAFSVVVRIDTVSDEPLFTNQVTIPCRDAEHAEFVRKLLTNCAEQEKKIALQSAGETTNV
jgi:hypothetical protein